jgi:hypothetical protein
VDLAAIFRRLQVRVIITALLLVTAPTRCYRAVQPLTMERRMSILYEADDDFGAIDHPLLLARIRKTLKQSWLFAMRTGGRLSVQASQIAQQVLAGGPGEEDATSALYTLPHHGTARAVSMHMDTTKREATRHEMRAIWSLVTQHLADIAHAIGTTPADLFRAQTMSPTDLPFAPPGSAREPSEVLRTFRATRRRLTFDQAAAAQRQAVLAWHRLTIAVQVPEKFTNTLAGGLAVCG